MQHTVSTGEGRDEGRHLVLLVVLHSHMEGVIVTKRNRRSRSAGSLTSIVQSMPTSSKEFRRKSYLLLGGKEKRGELKQIETVFNHLFEVVVCLSPLVRGGRSICQWIL